MDYAWLAQELERERQRDLRAQARLRHDYEQQGIDYNAILEAQRGAFSEAMRRIEEQRRIPTQLELPGVVPSSLEQLRFRDQLTPQEAVAAGVIGVGWQQSPAYPQHQQLDLESLLMAKQLNELTQGQAAPQLAEIVEELAKAEPQKTRSGRRLAMRWGLPAAGGALGLYALSGLGINSRQDPEAAY